MHWHWSSSEKSSFYKPIASVFISAPIIIFPYGAKIFSHPLVQLTGHVSALIGYMETYISHHICIFEFFKSQIEKLKWEFANSFVIVCIHECWSLCGPKVLEKFKLKFWRSFNQKNIYYERYKQFWTLKPWIRGNKSFAQNEKVLHS